MRQYVEKVKQEHSNKIQALRSIEANFKEQLLKQGKNR